MIYFGKLGNLVALPSPSRGMDTTAERAVAVHATIGGGRSVSYAPGTLRTYKPQWATLTYDTYATLEAFYQGHNGAGPWVLVDTGRRNHLTANQSSATAVNNNTAGWSTLAGSGELLTSATTPTQRGYRSLRWRIPATGVAAGILTFDPPNGLAGVPAPTGKPWTFTAQIRSGSADPIFDVTAVLQWRDANGAPVALTSGTPVTTTASAWTQVTVTAAAPLGACFVPQLRATTSQITSPGSGLGDAPVTSTWVTGGRLVAQQRNDVSAAILSDWWFGGAMSDLYVDSPLLDLYAGVRAWAPGSGVPRVTFSSLTDIQTWTQHRMPIDATFDEVR